MTDLIYYQLMNRLPQIRVAAQALREILQQLHMQKNAIEEDIHFSFTELHKTLDTRKSVLLMELEVTYGLKQKVGTYLFYLVIFSCLTSGQ